MQRHLFFWGGPFSQWSSHGFIVDGVRFRCAEQWMMYKKAMLFGDVEVANQIMEATDPKRQKLLGRRVRGFDQSVWGANRMEIVITGNLHKFSQNPNIAKVLLDSVGLQIVEASPVDKVWGIGLSVDVARKTPPEKWPGENLLGKALMEVRDRMLAHQPAPIEL